jgi:hypothetical protein
MRAGLTLAIILVSVTVARGDSSEEARALFERGTALYALHRFADAAALYEKAFELKPDPAILYNAAQAHRLAGNKARALDLYESYLRLYGQRPNRAEVNEHIRQLKSAIEAEHRATSAPPVGPASIAPPRPGEPAAKPAPNTPAPAPKATSTTVAPATTAPPPAAAAPPTAAPPTERAWNGTAPAPLPVATAAGTSPGTSSRPLVKRPWFWVVIGGAAVAVAAGIALGVTLGSSTKDPTASYGVVNGN